MTLYNNDHWYNDQIPSLRMKAIMRWGFVLFMIFLPLLKRIQGTSPVALSNFELSIFLGILIATTLGYSYIVFQRRECLRYQRIVFFTKVQILFDFFFITALIYFTGGIDSNLYSIYFFPILSSIVVFTDKGMALNALLVIALYVGLIGMDITGIIPHHEVWNHTSSIISVPHVFVYQSIFVSMQIIIFSFIAIAMQRAMQAKQLRIIAEYEKLRDTQSHFLATAAHQLRTPLTSVKWFFTSMIEDGMQLTQRQNELLEQAHARNNEIIELVNDLLHISEIDEETQMLEYRTFPVSDMIGAAVHTLKEYAQKQQVIIDSNHGIDPHIFLYGDRKKLDIAFTNIVENAIKYSPPHSTVIISVKKKKQMCVITVQDSGIGIPEDAVDHIFSKFFRARNAQRYILTGSGLGLFIVKKIIEQHQGRIDIQSVEGEGTTCVIELPIAVS